MQYGEVRDKNLFVEVYTATLKIYDRLRRARAVSLTQDQGIRHIAAKLFWIEAENDADNLDDEGRNGGEYSLRKVIRLSRRSR